ncbi:MAG: hypothetical protein WBL61_08735 [Bryobacteraceae bacterium]
MQAVLQFNHGNRREHDLGFSALLFDRRKQAAYRFGFTLGDDQHTGIED